MRRGLPNPCSIIATATKRPLGVGSFTPTMLLTAYTIVSTTAATSKASKLSPKKESQRKVMNDKFDELAKGMAQSVTRRSALKKFGVGLAAAVLASLGLV